MISRLYLIVYVSATLIEAERKPSLHVTFDYVEGRPRYVNVRWKANIPHTLLFKTSRTYYLTIGYEAYRGPHYAFRSRTYDLWDKPLYVEYGKNDNSAAKVYLDWRGARYVLNVTLHDEDRKVVEGTEWTWELSLPALYDLKIVDFTYRENFTGVIHLVYLKWRTANLQLKEKPTYNLTLDTFEGKWRRVSTVSLEYPGPPEDIRYHELNLTYYVMTTPKLRLQLSPVIEQYAYKGNGVERIVHISYAPGTPFPIMNGTTVKMECTNQPFEHFFWVYQEGENRDTEAVLENDANFELNVTKTSRYRCYSKAPHPFVDYHLLSRDYRFIVLNKPPTGSLQVDVRLMRSNPRRMVVKWKVKYLTYLGYFSRVDIFVEDKNDVVMKTDRWDQKNESEFTHKGPLPFIINATIQHNQYLREYFIMKVDEEEIVPENVTYDIELEKVRLWWDVTGNFPYEEPEYILRIKSKEGVIEKNVGKVPKAEVGFHGRPNSLIVAVIAKVDEYMGPINETFITIPELVPQKAPTHLKANVSTNEITIDFEPIPADEVRKYGIDKGCQVVLCKQKEDNSTCTTKPALSGKVDFLDVDDYELYHAYAECYTGAGAGPKSPWMAVESGVIPVVTVKIDESLNLIITWSILTEKGPVQEKYIENVEVIQFKKDEGVYSDGVVVARSKESEHRFDAGLSPAYKFDINCYLYAVNVTLKNNNLAHGKSSETCYSLTSPSYLILYAVICSAFVAVAVLSRRKKLREPAPYSKTVLPASTSSTKSLSTSMSVTGKSKKGKVPIGVQGKTKTRKATDKPTLSKETKPSTTSEDKKAPKKK